MTKDQIIEYDNEQDALDAMTLKVDMEKDQTELVSKANDEKGWRWYTVNGKGYISVTTVLDIVCDQDSKDFFLNVTRENYNEIMKRTSELGTKIHQAIEDWHGSKPYLPECEKAMVSYKKLVQKHNIKPVWFEKPIWSDIYGFAGQVDMLAEVDGKLVILDVKTGQFAFKHGFQVGAYRLGAIERGLIDESVGTCVLYAPRNGDEGRIYTHKHFDFLEQRFLECLGLHRGMYPNQYRKLDYKYKWETPLDTYFYKKYVGMPEPKDFGLNENGEKV